MHNVDGPNISASELVNIDHMEGQLPIPFTSEPDWEALAFVKNISTCENHFNVERKVRIMLNICMLD